MNQMPILYFLTLLLSSVLGLVAAAAAGAISGVCLASNDLGTRLAACLGGLFGLLGGLCAVAAGLLITQLV
jgi:hypothetical protein